MTYLIITDYLQVSISPGRGIYQSRM